VSLKPNSTFGRYRIDGPLGEGGMSTVYRAFEPGLDRHVALKILPSEFAQDKTFNERFDREAKMVARLEHPSIIPIFAYGIEKGMPWMAMRLVGGGNLVELAGGRPLPPRRAASIIAEVADALDYAHAKGVIHRDVKPQNILLDENGRVYLADFGIARMTEGAQRLTQAGMVAGTPHYMAPEQASGGKLDARVDTYALGIVAYEMFTGRTPFQAKEPLDVLMKHISDPVPVPAKGTVPDGIIEPLLKCLAKHPDDRWPTAKAFADALVDGLDASNASGSAWSSEEDHAPTEVMERPDFDNMKAPEERTYEPTVLVARVTAPPAAAPKTAEPPAYEPTRLVPRVGTEAKGAEPPAYEPTRLVPRVSTEAKGGEPPAYEPTKLMPRVAPPAAPSKDAKAANVKDAKTPSSGVAKPAKSGDNSGLKVAAAVLVGFGLLLTAVGGLAYMWWSQRNVGSGDPAAPLVLAEGGATNLPVPPPGAPAPAAEPAKGEEPAAEEPAAQDPAAPDPATPDPAAENPAAEQPKAPAGDPPAEPKKATAPSRPAARPARTAAPAPTPTPTPRAARSAQPAADGDSARVEETREEEPPSAAVPEASRSWTNASEIDRTVRFVPQRSVDLGVRVEGVPVDRVYITARDARSGIKKLIKKSTDKMRFSAEFLLNCPKNVRRPKLIFELELQRASGGVLDRLSEEKNCDGKVKLSSDIPITILDEVRKLRIRVRSAG
jgi:predicted Ser/Thr protein kinase